MQNDIFTSVCRISKTAHVHAGTALITMGLLLIYVKKEQNVQMTGVSHAHTSAQGTEGAKSKNSP